MRGCGETLMAVDPIDRGGSAGREGGRQGERGGSGPRGGGGGGGGDEAVGGVHGMAPRKRRQAEAAMMVVQMGGECRVLHCM